MKKLACLFPGQGSQSVGMGSDLFEKNTSARRLFEEIDRLAGRSLSSLCFNGPEEELKRTINTQPTILAVSLAAWTAFKEAGGPRPDFVAGHSLGEFTALCAAGALSTESVVKLVEKRAALMESCPRGAMSAVIGAAPEKLEQVCREASAEVQATVIVANFNTKEQLVVSGDPRAVEAAGAGAKAAGAKVIPLPVGGAFHSPLMESAAGEFAQELAKRSFADASIPVIQNVDARPASKAAELSDKLSRQMSSAVRWCDTIECMLAAGVDTFVEIGPGKALAGMIKKINRSSTVYNVYDTQTLDECLKALAQAATV